MIRRRLTALGLGLAVVASLAMAVALRGGEQEPAFPHERHAHLFPHCTGCHRGVPEGDRADFYPPPDLCGRCHDGQELPAVQWTPPDANRPDPVEFSHAEHPKDVTCDRCHTEAGAPAMAIHQEVVPQRCFTCHQHEATSHFIDADCRTCHLPAAESPMGASWLTTVPYPADHATGTFLPEDHGEMAAEGTARCATCHTREKCESCHVNAAELPPIARIPAAPPSMKLPRYVAHYVAPPSHQSADFLDEHGRIASVAACSTCHTRNDCETCHTGTLPDVAASLPTAEQVRAPGVLLEPRPPSTHQLASFIEEHGTMAAADPASCTSCHARTFCSDCHEAAAVQVKLPQDLAGPRFHPTDFMARHSTAAYGRRLECASCHNVAAFCRDCHEQAGFEPSGRLGAGFHDAEPNWLLRHGDPARKALESCATCHQQSDCLQCHSELGSFKVSPHGPDFDPKRAHDKNPAICLACHIEDPIG